MIVVHSTEHACPLVPPEVTGTQHIFRLRHRRGRLEMMTTLRMAYILLDRHPDASSALYAQTTWLKVRGLKIAKNMHSTLHTQLPRLGG
jgi:hypothetical protein